jgi:hypothetical protein
MSDGTQGVARGVALVTRVRVFVFAPGERVLNGGVGLWDPHTPVARKEPVRVPKEAFLDVVYVSAVHLHTISMRVRG